MRIARLDSQRPVGASVTARTWRQHTDEHFTGLLRRLHQQPGLAAAKLLDDVLAAAVRAGWTGPALGEALGLTRERIRQRARAGNPDATDLPDIPPPPEPPPPPERPRPTSPERPRLTAEELAELKQLAAQARQVNGATPLHSPLRAASERFSELLDRYVAKGMPMSYLSTALGLSHSAVQHRLGRHQYRPRSPSQQLIYARHSSG